LLLSETLEGVQAMDGRYEVLHETQQKKLKYAGLELATAVIRYLVKAIVYLEDKGLGISHLGSRIDSSSSTRRKKITPIDHSRV
jgi:hypothetical protein